METTPFIQSSEIGQLVTNMVFLLKMRHVKINYAFQLFWIILGKKLLKASLFNQKVIISDRSSELLWKLVLLNNLFMVKSWGIFLYDGNKTFCSNQWNRTNINKNVFHTPNEPYWAKLFLSVVLSHIWEIFF